MMLLLFQFSVAGSSIKNETNNFLYGNFGYEKAKELGYVPNYIRRFKISYLPFKKEWKCCDNTTTLKDVLTLKISMNIHCIIFVEKKEEADKLANHFTDYYQNLK